MKNPVVILLCCFVAYCIGWPVYAVLGWAWLFWALTALGGIYFVGWIIATVQLFFEDDHKFGRADWKTLPFFIVLALGWPFLLVPPEWFGD